jgi:hypothetical protein
MPTAPVLRATLSSVINESTVTSGYQVLVTLSLVCAT